MPDRKMREPRERQAIERAGLTLCISLVAFSLGPSPNTSYNTLAKVERDGFGGREMTSINVPDTFGSPWDYRAPSDGE